MNGLNVTGCFEGGNPQEKNAVSRISGNVFLVKPFCEDNQINYKFRLDVAIDNDCIQANTVNLVIDWDDSIYGQYRDTFYVREPDSEWRPVQGTVSKHITRLNFPVLPGRTYLALNPSYNYSQYIELEKKISSKDGFSKRLLYTTDLGREVHLLTFGPAGKRAKRVLITARTHPYESAGSYCVEGILEGITKMGLNSLLNECELWIVPMVCPDGVADGLCRLNRIGSPDLSHEIDVQNDLCRAFMDLIDEVKPSLFLEFHNWMLKNHDGIFYLSAWDMANTILRMYMRTNSTVRKPWIRGLDNFVFKRKSSGLKQYAAEKFGTKTATVEFPWFNRSPNDIRILGLQTFLSILPIA
jgi:hypothetical protein